MSYSEVINSLEELVCVRLSSCGYGSKEEMLKSLCSLDVERRKLNEYVESSVLSSSVLSSSVLSKRNMPWCGCVRGGCCIGLKKALGLYTQCEKECSGEYCSSCLKLLEKNGGKSPYGTVHDRMKCGIMEYKDPEGKRPIAFRKIMKKLNLSREEVELEGKRLGISIPECHFEEEIEKRGRGRPKKDTSAEDTASDKSVGEKVGEKVDEKVGEKVDEKVGEKKKRGRPKKEKEIISNNAGEDLIASLMQDVSPTIKAPELEKELEPEEEEEEETDVEKFEFNGTTYLKSEDNILYDINSHEGIGIWNEEKKEIENLPDDDDED